MEPQMGDVGAKALPDEQRLQAGERSSSERCPVCGVKLSLYNPGPNCWQHTMGRPWRGPSAKPKF